VIDEDKDQRHAAEGFRNWQLPISGLVARPTALSLDQIKGLASRTQITAHVCEQGWSAIGEWTGAPLKRVLEAAGGVTPAARYVVIDTYDGWYEGYDLFEVAQPQTLLAYGLNGRDLRGSGAPSGCAERQCGYKNLKFRSRFGRRLLAGFGKGGRNRFDFGFHWCAEI
jgi:DMSO/TMAO reductase YedYZ molybdopterin-dependent catalytic subunit